MVSTTEGGWILVNPQPERGVMRGPYRGVGQAQRTVDLDGLEQRIRALVGSDSTILVARPDGSGRLRVVSPGAEPVICGTRCSRWRRLAFREGNARVIDLGDGRGIGVFPMIAQGRPVGVLQVEGSRGRLDRNRMMLEILAEHLAMQTAMDRAQRDELAMGVAWTAHEIRGPLLGLRSALETLLGRATERRDQALLRASLSELERLVTSSRDLLDLAVGQPTMDVRPADVVRIVEEAVTAVRLEGGDERVVVHSAGSAIAQAIPIFLHTAIVNLLRNALAYSDPGSKVEVTVERHEDRVDVSVTNEGAGIPADERKGIFDPFVRGNSGHRTPEGRGLGLFIAWRAIDVQGGRIRVEPELHGATFRVTLPARGGGPRRSGS